MNLLIKDRKKHLLIGASVAFCIILIIAVTATLSGGKRDVASDKLDQTSLSVGSHISKLQLVPDFKERTRNGRILREHLDHETLRFFQGSATWNRVKFPFRSNEWKKQSNFALKKPGVYEWSVSPPCHNKLFSIYRGFSKNLENRFKQYIHNDGIYPKGEELKTLFFKELASRGFKFSLRFKSTDRGAQFARNEEEHGPKGGLKTVDYPFNNENNGGYRQPFFKIGNDIKLVIDFPIWPESAREDEMCTAKAA